MNALTLTKTDPQFDYSALDRADLSPTTREKYKAAILRFLKEDISPFDYPALASHAASLPSSSRAFLKAALGVMAREYENIIKSGSTAEHAATIKATLHRLEAMDSAIQVHTPKGQRAAVWLSNEEVEAITALPDRSPLPGRRDWIVLAALLGAGLRRAELAGLTFAAIKRQPKKNGGMRAVLEITNGKGDKARVVPISPLLESRLNEWRNEAGDGRVARSVNKVQKINGSLSAKAINDIVHKYGAMVGLPELEAHDLRRTWAQIGVNAGVPFQQISTLLGHSNFAVTQRYLDMHIDIESSISDFVPLH